MEKGGTNICSLITEEADISTTHPKSTPMKSSNMNKNSTQWVKNNYSDFFTFCSLPSVISEMKNNFMLHNSGAGWINGTLNVN